MWIRMSAIVLVSASARAQTPEPDGARTVPAFTLASQRIATPPPHLPQPFVNAHKEATAASAYKVCLGPDGHVSRTSVVTTLGKVYADEDVMKQVRETWAYKPRPAPVCFVQRFQFKIRDGGPSPGGAEREP